MKKLAVIMVAAFAVVGVANANLITNGDFEAGNDGSWTFWNNAHVDAPDPIPSFDGDLCGGIWWSDGGILQTVSIGASWYKVTGDLLNLSSEALGNNRDGILRAEMGLDGVFWWNQDIVIDQNTAQDEWQTFTMYIDNTVAGANYMNIYLHSADNDGPHTGAGNVRFDNISVEAVPEPATMGLLGLFGGGLWVIRRKFRV